MACEDTRTGFSFNNPDTTSDYHAPGWGLLVSPDELRYDELFGNPLIAEADSQAITDEQLLDYAKVALAYMESVLNIDILPHRIRYDNLIDSNGNEIERTGIIDEDNAYLSRMSEEQKGKLYIRETGYPYRSVAVRHSLFIKLRRRPVVDVLSAKFYDPWHNDTSLDLMPYRIVKKGLSGTCYFIRRNASAIYSGRYRLWLWDFSYAYRMLKDYPDVFKIDYETGYKSCLQVPSDMRGIIKKMAAVTLMNIYGDGKLAAIASRSVSLNSVSESIGTTLSATSATFGARIIQYGKDIDKWLKSNREKYRRNMIGVL
jgi:hypothetical protein